MAERRRSGLTWIAVSTVVAGIGGYAITTIVARGLGPSGYPLFATFWSALYFGIGALSGVQQEVSRASRDHEHGGSGARLAIFTALAGAAVAVVGSIAAAVLSASQFEPLGWQLGLPLVVGVSLNVMIVSLTGVLYGVLAWGAIALVIILDVALRLGAIVTVLLLNGTDVVAVSWAAVAPFGLMLLLLIGLLGRRRFGIDTLGPQLVRNAIRAIGGGVGISVLVNGFPLLIALAATDAQTRESGALIYALILTRAPLVVTVLALQSYLIVTLRDLPTIFRRTLVLSALLVGGGALLAVPVWIWGADVIVALTGPGFAVEPWVLAGLVLASSATSALAVSGATVLARSGHIAYVAGWTVAAAVSVVLMLAVPLDLAPRVLLALVVGPVVGWIIHVVALRRLERTSGPSDDSVSASTAP
jgi:O-antigen/teichoic acid export membrane protein